MKKWMLWVIALAALSGSNLLAQSITGTWQGTAQVNGTSYRAVVKISTSDADTLKGVMYPSIDQSGQSLPLGVVSVQSSAVKFTVPGIGGNYEGKLSAEGNTMAGTWSIGETHVALNLTRATPESAWTIPEPPPPPVRMAANANPAFEVATIKPSDPNRPGKVFTVRGPDVVTVNTTLVDLATMAYDLHARQLVGLPAWAESDKYDITGRPESPGQPSVAQLKIMLQKLLADRFQLKFHRDKKELSVYAITVGKTGSKLTKSQADPNSLPGLFFGRAPAGMSFNVRNATLAEVGSVLQGNVLDKPVVDQTGLSEKYDFTLKFTPDQGMAGFGPAPPPPADNADAPPDLFLAFEQQLGLRLVSTKAPADVLVIDKVEKPSAN